MSAIQTRKQKIIDFAIGFGIVSVALTPFWGMILFPASSFFFHDQARILILTMVAVIVGVVIFVVQMKRTYMSLGVILAIVLPLLVWCGSCFGGLAPHSRK